MTLFLTPFFYSLFNLEETYESYSAYLTKTKLLDRLNDHYLILGYGNLGRRIVSHTIWDLFVKDGKKIKKEMRKELDIIIDNNMNLKVVATNFAIINKNEAAFTQIISLPGIQIGFVETGRDKDLWVIGICGDASNLSLLEILNYKKAKLIVDATPDLLLPLKIFNFIVDKDAILAVPDSASYFSLFRHTYSKDIFLIFPTLMGSISIANLMFLFLEKIRVENRLNSIKDLIDQQEIVKENKILIIAGGEIGGRGLFYVLERFRSLLVHELGNDENRKINFLKNLIVALCYDRRLEETSKIIDEKSPQKRIWEVSLARYKEKIQYKYKIPVYLSVPFDIDVIKNILKSSNFESEKAETGKIGLIVIFSKEPFESFKILMSVLNVLKAISENYESEKLPLILISSGSFEKDLIKNELECYSKAYKNDDQKFPTQRDLQLVHDYTVADEVASIFRAWPQTKKDNKEKISKIPFSISLCIKDSPGALTQSLFSLGGFKISGIDSSIEVPSFHASNTHIDRKFPDSYIFEGIASLEIFKESKNFLRSIFVNCGENLLKQEILKLVLNLFGVTEDNIEDINNFRCPKYCSVCPISVVANSYDWGKNRERLFLLKEVNKNENKETKENKRAYAKIWIYGDNASIPGALAIGLKDLLMIRKNRISINTSEKVLNIRYISNIECPEYGEYTLRNIYATLESGKLLKERKNILEKGTLKAICIKSADQEKWNKYANNLLNFLNSQYNNSYSIDEKLRQNFPHCNLILQKQQDADFVKRILRKIEAYWNEEEIDKHLEDLIKEGLVKPKRPYGPLNESI